MDEENIIKLLKSENQLLRQAIIGLVKETGVLFCFSCFNSGKKEDYYATTCKRCGEWTCDNCSGIHREVNKYNTEVEVNRIEYCCPCYEQIKDKDKIIQMKLLENIEPINYDRFNTVFKIYDVIDNITDMINDFFGGGEYYQYEINYLNLLKSPEGHCQIGFYFDLMEEFLDRADDIPLDELKEDLASYLYNAIDGFHFDADSAYINPGETEETITLYLEF